MSSRSSKKRTEEAGSSRADLPERVLVGRVLRSHGLKGEVVVEVLSDVPGRLDPGSSLLVTDSEGDPKPAAGQLESVPERVIVAAAREHTTGLLVRFAEVKDRDGADLLRGTWLAVERAAVPPAPEGTYYLYELVGCRCRDGARDLGVVVDVVEDGGGLLLIVEGSAGGTGAEGQAQRVPIPFVERFLREIDVVGGTIALELPPGLVETCASTS